LLNLVNLSAKTFAQAAQIAEKIESLEAQLKQLLQGAGGHQGREVHQAEPAGRENGHRPRATRKRRGSRTPQATPGRTGAPAAAESDGRGTLRPAVVNILEKSRDPLKTAEIYDALVAQGYQFTFKEAKKVLGIRLYKMLGVQPLGKGLFKAK
jgi:hypothetical protein